MSLLHVDTADALTSEQVATATNFITIYLNCKRRHIFSKESHRVIFTYI
jgi:hypothetical protein